MYKVEDRLVFVWRKPWKGTTPGTITNISKRYKGLEVTVEWDDGTTTKTSEEFLEDRTVLLNADKVH